MGETYDREIERLLALQRVNPNVRDDEIEALRQQALELEVHIGSARPRLDAARFMWAGVPSLSFSARGDRRGPSYYHLPTDNLDIITPEIMEDLAQLLFLAILDMDSQDGLNFRK